MIFAKLDVCYWRHPKFRAVGEAAAGYWAGALAYLRENESEDGIILDKDIGAVLLVGVSRARRHCELLVREGLFDRAENGYLLIGYTEKNESKSRIIARREEARARKDSWRARNGTRSERIPEHVLNTSVTTGGNAFGSGSGSPSVLSLNPDPEAGSAAGGNFNNEGEWWAEGVRSVLGGCTAPSAFEVKDHLIPAAREWAKDAAGPLTGEKLAAWFRREAAAFAQSEDAKFGVNAKRFAHWLTKRRLTAATQAPRPPYHRVLT